MSKNYKYTNEITADGADNKTSIGPNDVVLLNGKNIIHSVESGDAYDGINPIPSFDFVRGISAATSFDIADIRGKYFNLTGDNVVTGQNTFKAKQTFSDADIANLSVEGLSADFSVVLNTKPGKISSLHKDDEIATINGIYRMVDNIIVEAGLKDVIGQYKELYSVSLDTLISRYIKGIILNKQAELGSSQIVQAFSANSNPSVDECAEALQAMADLLDIAPYSLDSKIQSIEESIDALDANTQLNIVELLGKIDKNANDISGIGRKINDANSVALLTSDTATSVITNFIQSTGKVTLSAKQLLSSDVSKLDGFVNDKIDNTKTYVASHYLPLSGGNITGELSANSLSVKDSVKNIKVGNSELCALLKNEFTALSSGTAANIRDSLDFKYDTDENKITLSIAGKESYINASRFTEAKMLYRVEINTGTGAPVLWLYFKVENGIDEVSVSLSSITRLYGPGNGIDVQLDRGQYIISADDTICRRDDISALDCIDRFGGYNNRIITELKQENGLISYTTADLRTSNVGGLEDYNSLTQFVGSLSGNNGVISALSNSVNSKFTGLKIDDKNFKTADGKINVLTSLSQNAGKISYDVKPLAYTEISGLSDAIDSKLGSTGDQTLNGSLSVVKSLEVGGGKDASSGECGATAIGRNAVAKDEESFVWNGNAISADEYYSHGQHTFNVNPQNGIGGFYIGDIALSSTLNTLSAASVNTANKQLLMVVNNALTNAGITAGKQQSEITFENVVRCLFNLSQIVTNMLQ